MMHGAYNVKYLHKISSKQRLFNVTAWTEKKIGLLVRKHFISAN